jgi:hypothetical protein
MNAVFRLIISAALILLLPTENPGEVVYDNLEHDTLSFFNPGIEYGDEIELETCFGELQSCTITNFTFQYAQGGFSGNEKARIRFYRNDGPDIFPGAAKPATVLYDSGKFLLPSPLEENISVTKSIYVPDIPKRFTWTIQFFNINIEDEVGGLSIFHPLVIGGNFIDYWQKRDGVWELRQHSDGIPLDFGARFEATDLILSAESPLNLEITSVNQAGIELRISGPSSSNIELQVSDDLQNWRPLTTLTSVFMPIVYIDTSAAPNQIRFYRLMLVQ